MRQQDGLPSALDHAMTVALDRRRHASTLRRLSLAPADAVDFSSNDFLSLSISPLLRSRFLRQLQRHSSLPLASGGSRLLDGNTLYALSLERLIATHHNASTALLTNSGYDANVAIFSTIPQPADVVIYDSLIHASVHDGMRASRAPSTNHFAFAHNDVSSFSAVLGHIITHFPTIATGHASIFVALEAIYSMDGDLAPLTEILAVIDGTLTREQRSNVHIIVDEAHATGVLGEQGRGLVCSLGLEDRVAIRLHTFGKALAANGAAILCSETIKAYLLNYARSLIYTTFMSLPALALARSSYKLMVEGHTGPLVARLRRNVALLHRRLDLLQVELAAGGQQGSSSTTTTTTTTGGDLLRVEPVMEGRPRSPIFSVHTVDPRGLAAHCQRRGYVVRPIMPPTVPRGSERVRVCLHAGNTKDEIRGLTEAMREWCLEQLRQRRLVHRHPVDGQDVAAHETIDRAKL